VVERFLSAGFLDIEGGKGIVGEEWKGVLYTFSTTTQLGEETTSIVY
jgi:hypothetical protein